ncbi:MAG: radical SAM protein [Pseudomonadota bacterium]
MSEPTPERQVLRTTRGRCSLCLQDVPAEVVVEGGRAWLVKRCPEHGETRQLLALDPVYWAELDRYYFQVNGQSWPQRDFLLRLTERCNLDCPICLAKANTEETTDLDLSNLEELIGQKRRIKVDFMAAEPTLRQDLEGWVRKVKAQGHIAALHSNGLRLTDKAFCQRMKDCGFDEVFLQFDGFDAEATRWLRGRGDLVPIKLKAIQNLREVGLATNLTVVVAHNLNEAQISEVLRFALQPENDHIREVFFLGLRILGSLRDMLKREGKLDAEAAVMPDETLQMLVDQWPDQFARDDIRIFNKLYFALLSTFKVKKCLYVQHYLALRDGKGGLVPFRDLVDMRRLDRAADRYAAQLQKHPSLARARFLASLARQAASAPMLPVIMDFIRLQLLFRTGMKLDEVSRKVVMLGFITACDPYNFDEQVAVNCGKGELSMDGGFMDSGAVANVLREARFDATGFEPGALHERGKAGGDGAPADGAGCAG